MYSEESPDNMMSVLTVESCSVPPKKESPSSPLLDNYGERNGLPVDDLNYRSLQKLAKCEGLPCNLKKESMKTLIKAKMEGDDTRVNMIIQTVKEERQSRKRNNELVPVAYSSISKADLIRRNRYLSHANLLLTVQNKEQQKTIKELREIIEKNFTVVKTKTEMRIKTIIKSENLPIENNCNTHTMTRSKTQLLTSTGTNSINSLESIPISASNSFQQIGDNHEETSRDVVHVPNYSTASNGNNLERTDGCMEFVGNIDHTSYSLYSNACPSSSNQRVNGDMQKHVDSPRRLQKKKKDHHNYGSGSSKYITSTSTETGNTSLKINDCHGTFSPFHRTEAFDTLRTGSSSHSNQLKDQHNNLDTVKNCGSSPIDIVDLTSSQTPLPYDEQTCSDNSSHAADLQHTVVESRNRHDNNCLSSLSITNQSNGTALECLAETAMTMSHKPSWIIDEGNRSIQQCSQFSRCETMNSNGGIQQSQYNYELEPFSIRNVIATKCKYGCGLVIHKNNMYDEHDKHCKFQPLQCPLANCESGTILANFKTHLYNVHYFQIYRSADHNYTMEFTQDELLAYLDPSSMALGLRKFNYMQLVDERLFIIAISVNLYNFISVVNIQYVNDDLKLQSKGTIEVTCGNGTSYIWTGIIKSFTETSYHPENNSSHTETTNPLVFSMIPTHSYGLVFINTKIDNTKK